MKSFKQELDRDLGLPFEFSVQEENGEPIIFITSNILSARAHLWCRAGLKNRFLENEVTIYALLLLTEGKITLYDAMKSIDTKIKVIEFDSQKGFFDGIYKEIDQLAFEDRVCLDKNVISPDSYKDIEKMYLKHFLGQTIF